MKVLVDLNNIDKMFLEILRKPFNGESRKTKVYGNNLLLMRTVNNYKIYNKELYYEQEKNYVTNHGISDASGSIFSTNSTSG